MAALDRSLAIIEFTPQGRILSVNANFSAAMGYKESEIVGQHHSLFVDPAFARSPDYKAFWAKLARGEFDAQEYRRFGKGGREVWIQASYSPVRNLLGRVTKVVKVATDITREKHRNADYEGKVAALSRVQAVIEFTPVGEILTANDLFLGTMGYSLAEVQGKHHRMFVSPDYARSSDYAELWARLNRGDYVSGDFQRVGKGTMRGEAWIRPSRNSLWGVEPWITHKKEGRARMIREGHLNRLTKDVDGVIEGLGLA